MALIFHEGYDWPGAAPQAWLRQNYTGTGAINRGQGDSQIVPGRYGGQALALKNVSSNPACIDYDIGGTGSEHFVAFSVYFTDTPTGVSNIVNAFENSTLHWTLNINTSRVPIISRNFSNLQVATNAFALGQWYRVEMRVLTADAGSWEMRVDGTSTGWLSGTGDTRNGATGVPNHLLFQGFVQSSSLGFVLIDDLVVYTPAGGAPNAFLGNMRIETLAPDGVSSTQFTPTNPTNANLTNVNGLLVPSRWNESATVGHVDDFTVGNLSSTPATIHSVGLVMAHSRADSTTRTIRNRLRSGSTTSNGGTVTPPVAVPTVRADYWTTDPDTSAAWAAAGVNGVRAQYEVVS
jgi:hypothetical protein